MLGEQARSIVGIGVLIVVLGQGRALAGERSAGVELAVGPGFTFDGGLSGVGAQRRVGVEASATAVGPASLGVMAQLWSLPSALRLDERADEGRGAAWVGAALGLSFGPVRLQGGLGPSFALDGSGVGVGFVGELGADGPVDRRGRSRLGPVGGLQLQSKPGGGDGAALGLSIGLRLRRTRAAGG